jgi:putative addiction module antidote
MKVITMTQAKLTQIGNSLGVILPKEVVAHLNVDKGATLTIVEQPGGVFISGLDPEFAKTIEVAEEGMRRYKNALTELAK